MEFVKGERLEVRKIGDPYWAAGKVFLRSPNGKAIALEMEHTVKREGCITNLLTLLIASDGIWGVAGEKYEVNKLNS